VANYNENSSGLWGISDDEDGVDANGRSTSGTPVTGGGHNYSMQTEDEGDVIESVHDHRMKEGYGKNPNELFFSLCKIDKIHMIYP
jgi:hypothetical protein